MIENRRFLSRNFEDFRAQKPAKLASIFEQDFVRKMHESGTLWEQRERHDGTKVGRGTRAEQGERGGGNLPLELPLKLAAKAAINRQRCSPLPVVCGVAAYWVGVSEGEGSSPSASTLPFPLFSSESRPRRCAGFLPPPSWPEPWKSRYNGLFALLLEAPLACSLPKALPKLGRKQPKFYPNFGLFSRPKNGEIPMSACEPNFSGIAQNGDFGKGASESAQKAEKAWFLAFAYTYFFPASPKAAFWDLQMGYLACRLSVKYNMIVFIHTCQFRLKCVKRLKTAKNVLCVHLFIYGGTQNPLFLKCYNSKLTN